MLILLLMVLSNEKFLFVWSRFQTREIQKYRNFRFAWKNIQIDPNKTFIIRMLRWPHTCELSRESEQSLLAKSSMECFPIFLLLFTSSWSHIFYFCFWHFWVSEIIIFLDGGNRRNNIDSKTFENVSTNRFLSLLLSRSKNSFFFFVFFLSRRANFGWTRECEYTESF